MTSPACAAEQVPVASTEIDLSYVEGLHAYWRIYWPPQIAALAWNLGFAAWIEHYGGSILLGIFTGLLVNVNVLGMVLPRMWSKPYEKKGFAIDLLSLPDNEPLANLPFGRHCRLVGAILWRQFSAAIVAGFISAPLSVLLDRVYIKLPLFVYIFLTALAMGPFIIKLLLGAKYPGFCLRVRRVAATASHSAAAASQPAE